MVPLEQTGDFGYAARKLAEDRYEISYTTPRLPTSTAREARAQDIEAEKQRAHDLALWRAAQLAQRAGYPAFRVVTDSRDADITLRSEPDPFYDPWHYPYSRFGRGYGPYYPYHPYGPGSFGYGYRSDASARITTTLVVEFLRQPTDDSFDAAATATRLAERYGSATYPGDGY